MAIEQEQITISIVAEADLSSYQYRVITSTNAGYGTVATGTSEVLIGVLLNKPAARDRPAKVCIGGHTKAIAGAAISSLGYVGIHSAGAIGLITTTANALGRNLTTAAGSGEYVEILVNPFLFK